MRATLGARWHYENARSVRIIGVGRGRGSEITARSPWIKTEGNHRHTRRENCGAKQPILKLV